MFITVSELSRYWNINPTGVLHVGAHLGEEASDYEKFGWTLVTWVEAQPNLVKILNSKLDPSRHKIIEAAVWDVGGVPLKLNVASNSQSTSLLKLGTHSYYYPHITYVAEIDVITQRLDALIDPNEMPNFINLDIQGVELSAIKSLGSLLDSVDFIYTEVNNSEVYEGCTIVTKLDEYLFLNGFERVTTRWSIKEGWGDALYIRSSKIKRRSIIQILFSFLYLGKFYIRQIASRIFRLIHQNFAAIKHRIK